MNIFLRIYCLTILLCFGLSTAHAARDVQAELKNIKQQRLIAANIQHDLRLALGEVGTRLQALDEKLLRARKSYRNVKLQIRDVDKRLRKLGKKKKRIRKKMQRLYQQMAKEAAVAYQHAGSRSIWVDVLTGSSVTEIPHRQYLLQQVMQSQNKDREAWRQAMQEVSDIESKEKTNKNKLLNLQQTRKGAEKALVTSLNKKRAAAKKLRADLATQKQQSLRLKQQEQALQRLLNGLGQPLLESDKASHAASIWRKKGKLPWPLQGRVVIGFGKTAANGAKLSGVHISPAKRSEVGKLVHALGQGQVRYADWFGGYGLMMIVDYGHGIMAVYAHNDALHKQLGDWVEQGEVLAEAGSTGWIEDVRLYFEIREKGKPVNPERWCKKRKK